jgi:hypothetical protein
MNIITEIAAAAALIIAIGHLISDLAKDAATKNIGQGIADLETDVPGVIDAGKTAIADLKAPATANAVAS